MKFCTNCGAQLSDETKFCNNCGQKQEAAAPAAPVEETPVVQTYEAPAQSYEAPVQSYEAPAAPVYEAPAAQTYEAPAQTYEAPVQSYSAPAQTYEAPAQSYSAPAQTYEAPAQSYQAPAQQSYTAPAQQSYAAPSSQPKPGFVPGGGKKPAGGNKKFLAIGGVAVVVVLIIVLLVSCLGGGGKGDDVLGVYTGVSCKLGEIEVDLEDSSLELKEDDKASLRLEGDSIPCEWALDGEALTLSVEGYELEGTLEDETIVLDLEGMLYTFEKGAKANTGKDDTGDKETAGNQEDPGSETAGALDLSALTGEMNDCVYTILGAEHFSDYDGEDAIRVYYEFTNNSDENVAPLDNLSIVVTQDGYDIDEAYTPYGEELYEEQFSWLEVQPGVSVVCVAQYKLNMEGGELVMAFQDWWNEEDLFVAQFDPNNLPGAPDPFTLEAVTEPSMTADMSDEGTIGDGYYIYIDTAETIAGYDDETYLRVYFDFGNETDEPTSMWMATTVKAFQDGVELESGYSLDDCEEEDNYDIEVEAGGTTYAADSFILRSDSPVEVIVYDAWTEEYLGCVFTLDG